MYRILSGLCVVSSVLLATYVALLSGFLWWVKVLVVASLLFACLWGAVFYEQPPPSNTLNPDGTAPYHERDEYIRKSFFVPPPGYSLQGKIALVTGGSSGIGRAVAAELCRLGATVVVTARSEARAQKAAADIMQGSPGNGIAHGMALELASLADVRRFASNFLERHAKLDFLVENAGMAGIGDSWVTDDGFEAMYATNYLGHFLLLNLLLPALKAADGDVRVTATSSICHWFHTAELKELSPKSKTATTRQDRSVGMLASFRQYGNTKLAQILMCFELQRRLRDEGARITVTPVVPGFVATAILSTTRGEDAAANFVALTPHEGAQTTLHALLAPDMRDQIGFFLQPYYTPRHQQPPLLGNLLCVLPFEAIGQKRTFGLHRWLPHPDAHRRIFGTALWEASAQAVGLKN